MKLCLLLSAALLLLPSCNEEARPVRKDAGQSAPEVLSLEAPGFSGSNAYVHCARLCDLGPRPSGSPTYARQLAYLTEQLRAVGWEVKQEAFSLSNGVRMVNLHAVFPSPKADFSPSKPLLISCHIDTKSGIPNFVGADDGASGAALLLELARCLASNPAQAEQVELVFFDGEEAFARRMTQTDGLYGSRYDVLRRRGRLPRWQFNLDMLGGRNKMVAIPALDTSPALLEHYERALEALHLPPERWMIYPGSYLDDHRPFADAGVETLNLIGVFSHETWWHTEKDNMSRLSAASLEESGKVVLQLLRQLTEEGLLNAGDADVPAALPAGRDTLPAYSAEP